MAGMALAVNSGEVALVVNTPKSVLQIKAPANQRLLIKSLSLLGKQPAGGTDTPVKIRLTRSTGSFGTFSAATPAKLNPSLPETIQSTCGSNASIEPTSPTDGGLWWEVQPQLGIIQLYTAGLFIEIPGGASVQFEAASSGSPTLLMAAVYEE